MPGPAYTLAGEQILNMTGRSSQLPCSPQQDELISSDEAGTALVLNRSGYVISFERE
jgi:hypothetical protein